MASNYEDFFEKPCNAFPEKKRYITEQAAKEMILRRGKETQLKIYHCKFCLGWHLASIKDF